MDLLKANGRRVLHFTHTYPIIRFSVVVNYDVRLYRIVRRIKIWNARHTCGVANKFLFLIPETSTFYFIIIIFLIRVKLLLYIINLLYFLKSNNNLIITQFSSTISNAYYSNLYKRVIGKKLLRSPTTFVFEMVDLGRLKWKTGRIKIWKRSLATYA